MTITSPESPSTADEVVDVVPTIERLRATFATGRTKDLDWRETQLDGIVRFATDHTQALLDAMAEDLGRPETEGWTGDVGASIAEAKHIRKHVRSWAKPRRVKAGLSVLPATARVIPEPLGVALIISPWNYPVNLLLEPLAAAVAAGNCVVVKPSELAPATSGLIASELPRYLDPDAIAIIEGGVDTATALLEQQWDHIFFTGSTKVGRIVMKAAAEHLTPVTLELGGKSPTIVADEVDLQTAANRIAWGKVYNAGQTCIAPDYVLVTEQNRDALIDGITSAWGTFFGADPKTSPDFGRIVSERHHKRLVALLDGHTIAAGGDHDAAAKYLEPTIVVDPDLDSPLMTEEIFGPILPIVTVDSLDAAVDFVNARPKPLALYVFADEGHDIDRVLSGTSSGGACVNHTLFHFAAQELPFGGVGPSGMGRYHGKAGFDTFSNLKGVLRKPVKGETTIVYPPYTERKASFLRKIL